MGHADAWPIAFLLVCSKDLKVVIIFFLKI